MVVILWEEERAGVRNGNAIVTENNFSNESWKVSVLQEVIYSASSSLPHRKERSRKLNKGGG